MEIKITYLNDDFIVNFDDDIMAGTLLAFLINILDIKIPILNQYGNQIALQLWSTSYCLDLNQSFKAQASAISHNSPLGIAQTVNTNIEEFNLTMNNYLKTVNENNITFTKVDNEYSDFRTELKKGAAHFIQKIKDRNLEVLINDAYATNDFAKLISDFDENGLFTKHIMKSRYFMDDKSCDESPLYAIGDIARLTFDQNAVEFFITMLFSKALDSGINKFTIDKNGESDLTFEQSNDLYSLAGHPSYSVKLIYEGKEVEESFESLRYSLTKRLNLFNRLLESAGRLDKWFLLSNGSCLLTTENRYQDLLDANILAPDLDYFNPWEY